MKRFSDYLKDYRIYLASRSPRRHSLLSQAGIPFEVWLKEEVAEDYPPDLSPSEVAVFLSRLKANVYRNELGPKDILITADTIVVLGSGIMGKPVDRDDAIKMLSELSGKPHEVITGVCLTSSLKESVFLASTVVWFDHLERLEIEEYIDEFNPYDKAGSYGIQEWIGYIGIHRIEGSYFNVMGLPIQNLYKELQSFTGYKST
ncbi:MAG: Maf family nucleotide pyrophosphatase [Bacteroidia bacterium]|nr:Maf family nucleotide pyrophosphatase [Bacteroidia bacterium]